MNKVYTSYFAQIRNMGNGMYPSRYVPFSTALWDPKWFHDNKGKDHIFLDKNKVINGVRCDKLAPHNCEGLCKGKDNNECVTGYSNPESCEFLKVYRNQLDKIDFNKFIEDIEETLNSYEDTFMVLDAVPVFIVYETPFNKCSERGVIQEWFRDHGIECNELKFK